MNELYIKSTDRAYCKQRYEPISTSLKPIAELVDASKHITSIVSYNNGIYVGTYENGIMYKWNGADSWVQVTNQHPTEYGIVIFVYNGKIMAGTTPNGLLLEWDGNNGWIERASSIGEILIATFVEYNGELYAGTQVGGKLLKWNGSDSWIQVAGTYNNQFYINTLCVYNNKIYAGTAPDGYLFEWNGIDSWVQLADFIPFFVGAVYHKQTGIKKLIVYNNKLYAGTTPNGVLVAWNDNGYWETTTFPSSPLYYCDSPINDIIIYNNCFYCCTEKGDKDKKHGLYRIDTNSNTQLTPPVDVALRCLLIWNGYLLIGTNSCKLYLYNGIKWHNIYPGIQHYDGNWK